MRQVTPNLVGQHRLLAEVKLNYESMKKWANNNKLTFNLKAFFEPSSGLPEIVTCNNIFENFIRYSTAVESCGLTAVRCFFGKPNTVVNLFLLK